MRLLVQYDGPKFTFPTSAYSSCTTSKAICIIHDYTLLKNNAFVIDI